MLAVQHAMGARRVGGVGIVVGACVGEQPAVTLEARRIDGEVTERDAAVQLVEQASVLRDQVVEPDALQRAETLAHAGHGGAIGMLVVDERVVEVEQDGANHADRPSLRRDVRRPRGSPSCARAPSGAACGCGSTSA